MNGPYIYTWQIWPVLATAGCMIGLAVYAWRRRSVSGAIPFAVLNVIQVPWLLGALLVPMSADFATKILWTKFEVAWSTPAATASLCFALEYANLGRFLTRRRIMLLAVPPVVILLMLITNFHHWEWAAVYPAGDYIRYQRGVAGQIFLAYGYSLSWIPPLIFVWLFFRSPLHRWPVALLLLGQTAFRINYVLGIRNLRPFSTAAALAMAFLFVSATDALALFRFRLFDLIPIARGTMIEQMREGMLVLDSQHRVIDLNPAAERIVGIPAATIRGSDALQFLPMHSALSGQEPEITESEIHLGAEGDGCDYVLHHSSLKDRRGNPLGHLVLFHDVTEKKQAHAQLLEQQRAMATLHERLRIARELHDGVAQILAYMKLQAEVAQTFLSQDKPSEANLRLSRLVAAAQDAHADVREYIFGAGISGRDGFFPALERYLQHFGEDHGFTTGLSVSPEIDERAFDPTVEVQLLRMIQEALTNVRKHACAGSVDVRLHVVDGHAEAIVQDDGAGFDTALLGAAKQKFGLRFMRERAEEVGGCIRLHSSPGEGTRVTIRVPLRKGQA